MSRAGASTRMHCLLLSRCARAQQRKVDDNDGEVEELQQPDPRGGKGVRGHVGGLMSFAPVDPSGVKGVSVRAGFLLDPRRGDLIETRNNFARAEHRITIGPARRWLTTAHYFERRIVHAGSARC